MPTYGEWMTGAAGGTPLNVDRLNEPFHIRSVTYDVANDRFVWTVGRGRCWFGQTFVDLPAPATYYTNAPTINTTYYAYLTAAGVVINTVANPATGQVPLGGVTVGAAKGTLTRFDRRSGLDGLGAKVGTDLAGHLGAAVGAHAATAISYAGSANLSSTHVEGALDELDAEKAGLAIANVFTQPQAVDMAAPAPGAIQVLVPFRQGGTNVIALAIDSSGNLVLAQWTGAAWAAWATLPKTGATATGLDADKVDGFHFRVNGTSGAMEYSTDGLNWYTAGLTRAQIRAIARRN